MERFGAMLGRPINGTSLALFRIFFGAVMFIKAIKYLEPRKGISLKDFLYEETTFNSTYPGFGWVKAFPEPFWTAFIVLMGLAALCVALGVFYRAAAATLTLTYTYLFLTELAKYNNHYYLMCLFAFLLAVMPADRRFSISAWWKKRKGEELREGGAVPFWTVFLLRAQLFIVYFYGGLAKIDADWLTGVPMVGKGREILDFWGPKLGLPDIDPIWAGLFICWSGLIYDLSIGFLLIFRRTRLFGIVLTFAFHLSNQFLFPIGLFPAMAFLTTLVFFEPDWPVRFVRWLRKPRFARPNFRWAIPGLVFFPPVAALLGWSDRKSGYLEPKRSLLSQGALAFVILFLVIQITVPFRHFFIRGDAKWTEEGQDFSWRMMLRSREASHVFYYVYDREMVRTDENGRMHFDWSLWPEERPRTLYVPVDCTRFNWNHHQGLTATFEPNIGLRAIYCVTGRDDIETIKSQIEDQWKSLFGREVEARETLGFPEVFEMIDNHFAAIEGGDRSYTINRIKELASELGSGAARGRENTLSDLNWELEMLLKSSEREFVAGALRRLNPFILQGAHFPGERFLVVDDPELTTESRDPEKLTGGGEFLVWVDLGRLRQSEWRELPQWFVTFENRELKVVWNYSADLNRIQKSRFTLSPWMIRQFGIHIAELWEEQTGRRPEIRVVNNLMMNFRVPQPLIDPNVDIASTQYYLMRHNEWIMPLRAEVGSATIKYKPSADN